MSQLHKRFTDSQVKELFRRYCKKELERKYIQEIFGIKKRRFFILLKEFRKDPDNFSIQYFRSKSTRQISSTIEKTISKELSKEQNLIQDKDVSVNRYNYSYVKGILKEDYKQEVSLPTIISRAKANGFYLKPPFLSTKDIFCFRVDRTIDAYRRISLDKIIFKPNNAVPHENVNLRISPINKVAAEVRFWCNEKLIDIQRKN